MARLEDVCEILDSKRIPVTAADRQPGPYPYYGANGIQDYVADYIFDDELVLLAEDGGNFGSKDKPIAYRVSGKCWVNNHAHVLKPKQGLDVDYLCYSLMFYDVSRLVNGATRQKLTQADMRKMEIPFPTLEEQRNIAALLDKVSDLIAKRREQLDKLDLLVKAKFVEMFGDPIENHKGLPKMTGQKFFKLSNGKFVPENKRCAEGIPAYGGNGISWYTDEILYQEDTVVVGRVGFQSGNVHFVKGPLWITDNAMYISDYRADQYDLFFLYALMEHIDFTRFQDAGDLKKITQKPFMNMEYIMPTLEQQHEYVTFVQKTDKLKLNAQRSHDKLEMLKKALMQQYFG